METDHPVNDAQFVTIFADAIPSEGPLHWLTVERATIKRQFDESGYKSRHTYMPHVALREFVAIFAESRGRIGLFHFAGHADTDILKFEGTDVSSSAIARFFSAQGGVPFVFLNGCNTDQHVRFFQEAGVGAVLGTTVPVFDKAAYQFSSYFYDHFVKSKLTIEQSFDLASLALQADMASGYGKDSFVKDGGASPATREILSTRSKLGKRNIWVLHAFDDDVLSLTIDEIDNYISRQILTKQLVKPYAEWLISKHSRIEVSGLKSATEIDLRNIFVSLRGELSNAFEIFQSQKLLEEKIKALEDLFADSSMSADELQRRKSQLLGRSYQASVLDERDFRDNLSNNVFQKELNLVEAFLSYDRLVILGDPGTGKTTTVRWLALMLAHAWLSKLKNEDYNIFSSQFAGSSRQFGPEQSFKFDTIYFPVIVRVSKYADELKSDPSLELIKFLGKYSWMGSIPEWQLDRNLRIDAGTPDLGALIKLKLSKGEALVIFDGLDEIIDEQMRRDVVKKITEFVNTEMDHPSKARKNRNKLIVTSRIAGYHLNPLNHESLFHVTIQPMADDAIIHFTQTWMVAAHNQLYQGQRKPLQIAFEARELANKFLSIVFDPKKKGVKNLAVNPLLLSELAKMFLTEDQRLPDTRIDLYEKAAKNMLNIWRKRYHNILPENILLFENKIFYLLENIASTIHEEYPTGLIFTTEIEELVSSSLESFYMEHPQVPRTETLKSETTRFLRVLSEEVGILAARANNLFGFLHLTFEEFFAAKRLLRDSSRITGEILSKAYQPRWQEPLKLAIGYLGKKLQHAGERQKILQALLDAKDTMGALLPRSANLFALAIPEMNYIPDQELIRNMLLKLVTAYSSAGISDEGEVVRSNVEETLSGLKANPEVWHRVKSGFRHLLKEAGKPEQKNAIASILNRLETFDVELAGALIAARQDDMETWQWPIHKALRTSSILLGDQIGLYDNVMRKFLFENLNNPAFDTLSITENEQWIRILSFLYMAVIPENDKDQILSHKGIITDSRFSVGIIDLIGQRASPELLAPTCEQCWQNKQRDVEDRVDALLILFALHLSLPSDFIAWATDAEDPLLDALRKRLDLVSALLENVISSAIKATLSGMTTGLADSQVRNPYHLITALFKVENTFCKGRTSPINLIVAVPESIRSRILAEMWVQPFFSDDPAYNMAVVLDTSGHMLEHLGPEVIAESFVYVQQVTTLPPYEKWQIGRSYYMPQTREGVVEKALCNLLALSSDFDALKFWGLYALKSIWQAYPQLYDLCSAMSMMIQDNALREKCFKMIMDSDLPVNEAGIELEKNITSGGLLALIRATQHRILDISIPLSYKRRRHASSSKILDNPKLLDEIFELVSIIEPERNVEKIDLLLAEAELLISNISAPEQKALAYIRLLSYRSDSSSQQQLIFLFFTCAEEIEDLNILASCLKEIRPWLTVHAGFRQKWDSLTGRLREEVHTSVLEDRVYPLLKMMPENPEEYMRTALTQLGGLIKDLDKLLSLPPNSEDLWELLYYRERRIDEIAKRLYDIGSHHPFNLTIIGARGFDFLIHHDKELAKKLMPFLEAPKHEAVPIINEWLKSDDKEIQAFASILLLQAGTLNHITFPFLDMVLFGEIFKFQDVFRNRVNLALNQSKFYVSSIGLEGLYRIEESISRNWNSKPYLTRGLAWFYEYLVFDDPEIWRSILAKANNSSITANIALYILKNIHYLNAKVFELYLDSLDNASPLIRKVLLNSAIFVVNNWRHHSRDVREAESKLRKCLIKNSGDADYDVRLYAIDAMGYLKTLGYEEVQVLTAYAQNEPAQIAALSLITLGRVDFNSSGDFIKGYLNHENATVKNAAAEALTRWIIDTTPDEAEILITIVRSLSDDKQWVFNSLLSATRHRWWSDYYKKCVRIIKLFFERYPELYLGYAEGADKFLPLHRLEQKDYSYAQSIKWMSRSTHIDAFTAGAEKLPATYLRATKNIYEVEEHLKNIVTRDGIFTSRMNALTCLSLRREMTEDCTTAFCAALKDISEVQTLAIAATFRFWEISPSFIATISNLLDQESYSARYAIIHMLAAIGKYNKTNSGIRQQILNVLYSKLQSPNFKVPVFVLRKNIIYNTEENGTISEMDHGNIVEYKGRLDIEIYRKILEVAGIK